MTTERIYTAIQALGDAAIGANEAERARIAEQIDQLVTQIPHRLIGDQP